jgi:hypothetical protein
MSADFKCVACDPERVSRWQRLFNRDYVCVTTPFPYKNFNKNGEITSDTFYMLDLDQLTNDELIALAKDTAERFNAPFEEVITEIRRVGMPVLAKDTNMVILHPQKWFD